MRNKIISILTDISSEFDFSQNVNFIDQGMLDSFDVITLVTTLDEEFGISIEGLDIVPENFSSVDSILKLLAKYGVE